MTLIRCPECSNTISSQSVACPHCGYPIAQSPQSAHPPAAPVPPVNPLPNNPLPAPGGQSARNITTLLGIGVMVLLGIILLVTCSKSQEEPSAAPTTTNASERPLQPVPPKTPDTSQFLPIPMRLAGAPEDGRYFLMSHTLLNNGIHDITYLRTKNSTLADATDRYGKMQLNCELGEIRASASDNPQALAKADLGNWYTPIPNSTDRDIFNFICQPDTSVVTDAEAPADTPETDTSDNTATAQAADSTDATDTAPMILQDQPPTIPANKTTQPSEPVEPSKPKLTPAPTQDKAPSQPDNMSTLIAERNAYTQQMTRIIQSNWQLPMTPKFTKVRATFSLAPDGTISHITIHSNDMYAKSTLTQAIEASSPLPPIPKGAENYFAQNSLTFRVHR